MDIHHHEADTQRYGPQDDYPGMSSTINKMRNIGRSVRAGGVSSDKGSSSAAGDEALRSPQHKQRRGKRGVKKGKKREGAAAASPAAAAAAAATSANPSGSDGEVHGKGHGAPPKSPAWEILAQENSPSAADVETERRALGRGSAGSAKRSV
jgi:hypothetical protein